MLSTVGSIFKFRNIPYPLQGVGCASIAGASDTVATGIEALKRTKSTG